MITGIGLTSPVGRGRDDCWQNLLAGESGVGPITLFDARALAVRIGGEVKRLDTAPVLRAFPSVAGEKDRKILLGLDAALQAVADAGIPTAALAAASVHIGVSLETFFLEDAAAQSAGAALPAQMRGGGPTIQLQSPLDRLAELLGARWGLFGGRWTNCSACAAGAQAVGEAFRRLRAGAGSVALAGAADSILHPLGLGGFGLLRILAPENEHPTRACRPFDATRQGTVLSEGAAFLVLETLAHARARGAAIVAEIIGFATTLDAFRVSDPAPDGEGAARSMSRAIADAGLSPEQIGAINAHGTGTPKNDAAEALAIGRVFGAHARRTPVTANKSMTGHMIAASGAFEAAVSALTLHTGWLPPTLNLTHPDPLCDLDHVMGARRLYAGDTVLSNSFGFGGQNASLVFRRHPST
ncbi:MAG: beta-ketoacyl-[acyl-carrier-protein] synthase family protein [Opitutaceae bacterium]|nr:beta-ketoacyl-[acyl-carrier-protein] synthase family protein [Opitutaceae bacterium]